MRKVWLIMAVIGAFWAGKNYPAGKIKLFNRGPSPTPTGVTISIDKLKSQVLPPAGFTFDLKWGDLGTKLIKIGVIDRNKFDKLFTNQPQLLAYLERTDLNQVTINTQTAQFWVDVLWALGLANKSVVLDEGPMKQGGNAANFASTGGWTLGKKDAMAYYSKFKLIPLDDQQQARVKEIAENIYRPCCGNSTAFPDCNHGMAALALVEIMVAGGKSDEEIYKTVLAFNSYWFGQTYLEIAYLQAKNGVEWGRVDAKKVLGKAFSSGMGATAVKKQIGQVPGLTDERGSSCGV